jgi:hypothetical protein
MCQTNFFKDLTGDNQVNKLNYMYELLIYIFQYRTGLIIFKKIVNY